MKEEQKLKDDIWAYCRLNEITNIDEFTNKMTQQGFTVEKFGATPFGSEIKEVEKIVEVSVEKIVEKIVERIVEVPVEKIIEKEIYVTDDEEVKKISDKNRRLNDEMISLKNQLSDKTKDSLIEVLNGEIKEMGMDKTKSMDKVTKLEKEILKLKEKLESSQTENKKDDDIYNDNKKGGWFGSNILKK